MKPVVYLALPTYGAIEPEMSMAIMDAIGSGVAKVILRTQAISLLAHNFNLMWCEALNGRRDRGITHFAMVHGDVAPQSGWFKILLEELQRTGADVLSAVVPIKDHSGQTSTALLHDDGAEITKLTVADLQRLPPTFDSSHFPGKRLLGNTGLWICDFRKPWVEQVWFEIIDRIERRPDGVFEAKTMPEDWNFSRQCHQLGVKLAATQRLTLTHYGRQGWALPGKTSDLSQPEAA